MKPGCHMIVNNLEKMRKGLDLLQSRDVLVGIPAEKIQRRDGPMNNATLGYIHETGAPEANIPARPFLKPGVRNAEPRFSSYFRQAGQYALKGDLGGVNRALNAAGQVTADSVRAVITAGISPPLKQSTVNSRRARHKNRKADSPEAVTALIDTGQMYRAITYVVRKK